MPKGSEHYWGNFFTGWWKPEEVWFWFWQFESFSMLQHSVNTEHELKQKLAWPVCQKSMKLKQNATEAITTAKNDVFPGL